MKRLPFALIALSLSIPAVACLNAASDEEGAIGVDDLSEETKQACNFGFKAVENPIVAESANAPIVAGFGPKSDLAPGKNIAFGNFDKDKATDFIISPNASSIQAFLGKGNKGNGTFEARAPKKIDSFPNGRTRTALSIAAIGDFDGDGMQDVALAGTSTPKAEGGAAIDPADVQVDYRIVFGTRDGDLAYHNEMKLPPIKEAISFHVTGDFDGNGADDLVIVTEKGQTVLFGEKGNRTGTPGTIELANPSARVLAYATGGGQANAPATLMMITADGKATALTFDKTTRKATAAESVFAGFDSKAVPIASDLDQNGSTEISMLHAKLTISTVGEAAPLTFDAVTGRTLGALDFDNNGKRELLYTVSDESKLYAACGYEANAKALAAVELPIPYGDSTRVGSADLNSDGKPDFITYPTAGGDFKVYLADAKLDPAPPLTVLSSNLAGGADAGADTGTPDTGTGTTTDSGSDATAPVDAGPDADASASTDSGTDSGTGAVDAGKDSGTPTKPDAGAKPDQGDDDDDTEEPGGKPDDEETGGLKPPPSKKPSTRPSTSSGGVTITPRSQPQASDSGCSAAPTSSRGVSTSAIGGLFAAMMLLGRRRNRKK